MNKFLRNIIFGFWVLGILGVLYPVYLFTHSIEIEKNQQLAALLSGTDGPVQLNTPTKSTDCQAQGPLPDPECTPGAIFPDVTKEEICITGYSKTVRNVSNKLKKEVFARYEIEYPVPFGSYEIDHLIPLSLGGNNEIINLWPKSAQPFPGFWEKNITGNYLREEICDGRVALSIAQEKIAENWFLIYQNIDNQKIEELKAKYPNWADRRKK